MKKILVFGSFNYDMTARVEDFPKPGQTIMGLSFETGPGGKGSNQAIAAHRAGAEVVFATKIGNDSFGSCALETFKNEGMGTDCILTDCSLPTSSAFITVHSGSGQNSIVVNKGACSHISSSDIDGICAELASSGIILTQLETNLSAVEEVVAAAKQNGATVILNPAPAAEISDKIYKNVDIITPNETEAEALTGVAVSSAAGMEGAAKQLISRGVKTVILTLGSKGAYVCDGGSSYLVPAFPSKAIDTTGAGDVFNGALAAALSFDMELRGAVEFACAAGAISVTRPGAALSAPVKAEIEELISTTSVRSEQGMFCKLKEELK